MDDLELKEILLKTEEYDNNVMKLKIDHKIKENHYNDSHPRKKGIVEYENRELVLNTPIDENNIGFKLLQKMNKSWKPGMSLGKENNGISEPIEINISTGTDKHAGIGLITTKKSKTSLGNSKSTKLLLESINIENYINNCSVDYKSKKLIKDIYSCDRVILNLDEDYGKVTAEQSENIVIEANAIDTLPFKELLNIILTKLIYMRENYNYCFYCGTKYNDTNELVVECPGIFDDDHDF